MPAKEFSQLFFHGTHPLPAVCIAVDGFRLLDVRLRTFGIGFIGSGIYLTAAFETAVSFASELGYVLRVRLAPGTRILRLNSQFDPKVIDSLRREFGPGILSSKFDQAIPRNKKLRRVEFINLFNYLWGKGLLGEFTADEFTDEHRQVRRYLAKSQYHGMGDLESGVGVVVFNPSRLILDSVLQSTLDHQQGRSEAEHAQLLSEAALQLCGHIQRAHQLREFIQRASSLPEWAADNMAEEMKALSREVPRWQQCLQRFAERHHLPMDSPDLRRALEASTPLQMQ